jgi:hypothetical protein
MIFSRCSDPEPTMLPSESRTLLRNRLARQVTAAIVADSSSASVRALFSVPVLPGLIVSASPPRPRMAGAVPLNAGAALPSAPALPALNTRLDG